MSSFDRRVPRRTIASAFFVVTILGSPAAPLADPAEASTRKPCDERSWTGGTTEWCDGWLVYRDYVYDDYGADDGSTSPHGSGLARPQGDVDHREHGQALNSADLLVLRLRAEGGTLAVRFELNTLFAKDATVAALAIDSDDRRSTGGGAWKVVDARSAGWERVYRFDRRDARGNVITGRVPLPKLSRTLRIQAVVALGDGTPMNVAFRPRDHGTWWEDDQAAALAVGDISPFGMRISSADLKRRTHRPAALPSSGYFERVYRSDYPLGEGVDYAGVEGPTTALFHYLGKHQPYALYVPRGSAPHGAQLMLHGASAAHDSVIGSESFQSVFGRAHNRILVSPLGRGPNNSYVDWGARDVLDAFADVKAHYPVDPDAVFISGYSMGGGGTMELSTMFPDSFAGAVAWVPFSGDCFNGTPLAQGRQHGVGALEPVDPYFGNSQEKRSGCPLGARGNAVDYLDSLRHVPIGFLFAAADELVWANHAVAVSRRMEELGYEHRVWTHAGEHLTFAILDDWRKEAAWTAGRRRVRRPARLTYRTNTFLWTPELRLVPDGAYWVDEIRPRNPSSRPEGDMVVDLTSHACTAGRSQEVTMRRDAGTDPVPWVGQEGDPTGEVPLRKDRRISGTLTNVAGLLINVRQACMQPREPIALDLRSDGPALVRFSDGRKPVKVR